MKYINCYGIILKCKNKYLIVQRKYSYAYVNFILGHYNNSNIEKILYGMTHDEKIKILNTDFKILLSELLTDKNILDTKYKYSFGKYTKIKDSYINFRYSLLMSSCITESEWSFPKGRKNINETYLECALRELKEETNIDKSEIKKMDDICITDYIIGYNDYIYNYKYFAYLCDTELGYYDEKNQSQKLEIQKIKWVDKNELNEKFNGRIINFV